MPAPRLRQKLSYCLCTQRHTRNTPKQAHKPTTVIKHISHLHFLSRPWNSFHPFFSLLHQAGDQILFPEHSDPFPFFCFSWNWKLYGSQKNKWIFFVNLYILLTNYFLFFSWFIRIFSIIMGLILGFDWSFMAVLRHGSHRNGKKL